MTTMTKERRAVKVSTPRTVVVLERPTADADGKLLVTEGGQADVYFVRQVGTQIPGRAYTVSKFGADVGDFYHTLIGTDPRDTSCTCKGWTYRGKCRHVAALTTLTARNLV